MHTENATSNDGSNRKVLKSMRDYLKDLNIELLLALIIKSINLIKLAALMIPPKQEKVERVFDFHGH